MFSSSLHRCRPWASARAARVGLVGLFAFCISALLASGAQAQIGTGPEAAPPLVYNPEFDLDRAHSQSWSLAQDERGLLFVGNGNGLLSFDGARWSYGVVPLDSSGTRERIARTIAYADGRLYMGLVDAFGYADLDSGTTYRSLSDYVPDSARPIGSVWSSGALSDAVYFLADRHIFRIPLGPDGTPRPEHVQTFSPADVRGVDGPLPPPVDDAAPFLGFVWKGQPTGRDQFIVHVSGVGLCTASADGLRLLPGGERLAGIGVFGVVPAGPGSEHEAVVVTTDEVLWYDGQQFRPFTEPLLQRIAAAQPYAATAMPGGGFAIGTRQEGVFLLGPAGQLRAHVDDQQGLQSDNVTALLPDRDGGLWLTLNDGVSRIETGARVGRFDERSGLRGGLQAFARMPAAGSEPGRVYAGTGVGLYALTPAREPGEFASFELVEGGMLTVWSLLTPEPGETGALLVGTSEGLYRLERSGSGDRLERVWGPSLVRTVFALLRDPRDPSLLWAGGDMGLVGMRERDGQYEVAYRHELGDAVRSLFADRDGRIWGATGATGVVRLDAPAGPLRRYGSETGLAGDLEQLFLSFADDRPLALLGDSVRVYDPARDQFVVDPDWFGTLTASAITQTDDGRLWVYGGPSDDEQALLRFAQRGATPDTVLTRLGDTFIGNLYPTADGALWVTALRGLYRAVLPKPERPPLFTRVHRIATLDADSTLYAGFGPSRLAAPLPFEQRAVRFSFAAPSFDKPDATRYQVRLRGLDDAWGRWTDEAQRDYTNLSPGAYTFEVRARDVHGRLSEPAAFPFTVLPPWYRTVWAYGLYGLLALGLVAAAGWWQSALQNKREHALAREVQARTTEIERQARELRRLNRALEKQTAELRRTNEELWKTAELKAHLLGMAAHDLQTPLTSVLGFSDILLDEIPPHDERHQLAQRIRKASDDMRVLIRDLLDSVAAQTGRLQLNLEYVDLCEVAAEAVRRLEPQAERKHQTLRFLSSGPAMADVDAGRVRDAMTNLLSNAVKYAPPHSLISARALLEHDAFSFSVRDQGPGLVPEEQKRLFRPFERLSPQPTGGEASSGLGLFLVQEIAQLHGGDVHVDSRAGSGSTFTLLLPADPLPLDGASVDGTLAGGEGSLADGAVPAEREQQQ